MKGEFLLSRTARTRLRGFEKRKAFTSYSNWRNRTLESKTYICILFAMAGGKCPQCGVDMYLSFKNAGNGPDRATLDHINPISKTMEHDKLNLQIMCKRCNGNKKDEMEM